MTLTIADFLLARIAEDEATARAGISGQADPENGWGYEGSALTPHVGIIHEPLQAAHITRWHPARVLAECAAKRQIVEFHRDWPVLTESEPTFSRVREHPDALGQVVYHASQQMQWLTEQEYRKRFGSEPPTGRMLAALAAVYADHPDYSPDWRL